MFLFRPVSTWPKRTEGGIRDTLASILQYLFSGIGGYIPCLDRRGNSNGKGALLNTAKDLVLIPETFG